MVEWSNDLAFVPIRLAPFGARTNGADSGPAGSSGGGERAGRGLLSCLGAQWNSVGGHQCRLREFWEELEVGVLVKGDSLLFDLL